MADNTWTQDLIKLKYPFGMKYYSFINIISLLAHCNSITLDQLLKQQYVKVFEQ